MTCARRTAVLAILGGSLFCAAVAADMAADVVVKTGYYCTDGVAAAFSKLRTDWM